MQGGRPRVPANSPAMPSVGEAAGVRRVLPRVPGVMAASGGPPRVRPRTGTCASAVLTVLVTEEDLDPVWSPALALGEREPREQAEVVPGWDLLRVDRVDASADDVSETAPLRSHEVAQEGVVELWHREKTIGQQESCKKRERARADESG